MGEGCRACKTRTEMRALMRKTTWMNGEDAKTLGFADVVTEPVKMVASMLARVFERFSHIKPAIASGDKETTDMNREKMIALLKKLGTSAET